MSLSVTIVCFNEERKIRRCLESVKWADEIIVVDSYSTDRTREIAKEYTDKVVLHEWEGYVAQKNFAMSLATKEWIIHLDADESLSDKLQHSIRNLSEHDLNNTTGFEIKRHTFYLGRWINHCGWYPDWKVRMVRNGKARWTGKDPHDKLVLQDGSKPAKLTEGEILHYNYLSFSEHIQTIDKFSEIIARNTTVSKSSSALMMVTKPLAKFIEVYIYKKGFMDGLPGFIIASTSAFYAFTKCVKMWEKYLNDQNGQLDNR